MNDEARMPTTVNWMETANRWHLLGSTPSMLHATSFSPRKLMTYTLLAVLPYHLPDLMESFSLCLWEQDGAWQEAGAQESTDSSVVNPGASLHSLLGQKVLWGQELLDLPQGLTWLFPSVVYNQILQSPEVWIRLVICTRDDTFCEERPRFLCQQ